MSRATEAEIRETMDTVEFILEHSEDYVSEAVDNFSTSIARIDTELSDLSSKYRSGKYANSEALKDRIEFLASQKVRMKAILSHIS